MKTISLTLFLFIFGLSIGILTEKRFDVSQRLIYSKMDMDESSSMTNMESTEKKIQYWVAPMNPTYRRNEAGKSPMGTCIKVSRRLSALN